MNKSALDISSYCINIPEEGIKISPTHNKIAGYIIHYLSRTSLFARKMKKSAVGISFYRMNILEEDIKITPN